MSIYSHKTSQCIVILLGFPLLHECCLPIPIPLLALFHWPLWTFPFSINHEIETGKRTSEDLDETTLYEGRKTIAWLGCPAFIVEMIGKASETVALSSSGIPERRSLICTGIGDS